MPGESEIITVEILGTRLQLKSGDDPDAVMQACQMVYEQAEEIRNHAPTAPSLQIALMTAINIADELMREQSGRKIIDNAAKKAYSILKKTASVRS